MEFKKYQHIEKLGSVATEGILNGKVYLFSKLDGTNTGVYLGADGKIKVNSRNRVLSLGDDNAGVCATLHNDERFKKYFAAHPNHRLFGEWLVKHTICDYYDDAWRKLYIFDVIEEDAEGNEKYLPIEDYISDLIGCGIDFIPCLAVLENPTVEEVETWLDQCKFLMKDGKSGEGIVIKNYDFVNQFGHVVWAKIVRKIAKACQSMHKPILNSFDVVESQIVEKFLTAELVEKEFSKIVSENGGWQSKLIGKLLGVVWYTFITEEIFNALKKFHNPKIDFSLLNKLAVQRIKEFKSDVF